MTYREALVKLAANEGVKPGDRLVLHTHNPVVAVPPTGLDWDLDWKRIAARGALFGGGSGLLAYMLSGLGKAGRKRSKKKRLLIAALTGLGVGGFASLAELGEQFGAGQDFPVDPQLDIGKLEDIYGLKHEGTPKQRVANIRNAALAHPDITPVIPVVVPGGQVPGGTAGALGEINSDFNEYFGSKYADKRYAGKENWQHMAFFNRRNTKQMRRYIQQVKQLIPTAEFDVKGYSYGGGGAIWFADIAGEEGMKVRHLRTYDPVFWLRSHMGKPKTTDIWDNYIPANHSYKVFGDAGAMNGGSHYGGFSGARNHYVKGMYNKHHGIQHTPAFDDPKFNTEAYTEPEGSFEALGVAQSGGIPAYNPYRQWYTAQADEVAPGAFRKQRQTAADVVAKLKSLIAGSSVNVRNLPAGQFEEHRAKSWDEQRSKTGV